MPCAGTFVRSARAFRACGYQREHPREGAGDRESEGKKSPDLKNSKTDVEKLKKELEQSQADENTRAREQSLLEFELREIQEAGLKEGEDEQLEQDYRR